MKRNLFIKLIIFIMILIFSDLMFGSFLQTINKEIYTKKMLAEFYAEENNIDLLFMGSSHAYRSFDPFIFDGNLKLNSFNFGSSGQNPTTTYFLLKEVLRKGHKPQLLILETFWLTFCGKNTDYYSASYIFHYLQFSKNKIGLFIHSIEFPSSLRLFSKTFQYRRFFKNLFSPTESSYNCNYIGKGFVPCEKEVIAEEIVNSELIQPNYNFNKYRIKYFKKILELAQKHNIKVLAIISPIHPGIFRQIKNYNQVTDEIKNICLEYDITFLDFNLINQHQNFVSNCNFMDAHHLNKEGATIFSNFILPDVASALQESQQPHFAKLE